MPDDATAVCAVAREASHCFHCGEPNPAGARWHAAIDGVEASFCCAGCMAVAQTIRAAGLETFYERRDGASARSDVTRDEIERTSASRRAGSYGYAR